MKTVINRQLHPVTPEDGPAIPALGSAEIDETLPRNAALIEQGVLGLEVEAHKAAKHAAKQHPHEAKPAADTPNKEDE